jgi:hypothetical protein
LTSVIPGLTRILTTGKPEDPEWEVFWAWLVGGYATFQTEGKYQVQEVTLTYASEKNPTSPIIVKGFIPGEIKMTGTNSDGTPDYSDYSERVKRLTNDDSWDIRINDVETLESTIQKITIFKDSDSIVQMGEIPKLTTEVLMAGRGDINAVNKYVNRFWK